MLKLFKAGGSAECPQGPSACESSLNSVKCFKKTFILEVRRHEWHIFRNQHKKSRDKGENFTTIIRNNISTSNTQVNKSTHY